MLIPFIDYCLEILSNYLRCRSCGVSALTNNAGQAKLQLTKITNFAQSNSVHSASAEIISFPTEINFGYRFNAAQTPVNRI